MVTYRLNFIMTLHIIFSRTEYHVTMTSQWFSLLIELQSLFALSLEILFASEVSQNCPSAISRYRGISRRRLFGISAWRLFDFIAVFCENSLLVIKRAQHWVLPRYFPVFRNQASLPVYKNTGSSHLKKNWATCLF